MVSTAFLFRKRKTASQPWQAIAQRFCSIIVYEGLLAKFTQNELLKKQLKDTQNAILAECAVKDRIWGIGLSMNDSNRLKPELWKGQNLLGFALMMVRNKI